MDLYGLPPEEFTAARDAAAKQDKALKALRRPSVSAWVINTLVRQEPDVLDDLVALGAELAAAQQHRQADELRALGEQRKQLVATVARQAVGLVDRELSAVVVGEVEATLDAALVDPASAEAVRSGQLVRPLAFAGFGGVDLEGAVAPLPRVMTVTKKRADAKPAKPGPRTRDGKAVAAAEAKALDAAGLLDDAVRRASALACSVEAQDAAAAKARQDEAVAEQAVEVARAAVTAAEAELRQRHRARTQAEKEAEALLRKATTATRAVEQAQAEADAARLALDALRRA